MALEDMLELKEDLELDWLKIGRLLNDSTTLYGHPVINDEDKVMLRRCQDRNRKIFAKVVAQIEIYRREETAP